MSFLRDKANPMQECILANNHCQHLTNLDHVKPNRDDLVEVWVLVDGCMGFIEDNHAMQILLARRGRVEGNVRCSYYRSLIIRYSDESILKSYKKIIIIMHKLFINELKEPDIKCIKKTDIKFHKHAQYLMFTLKH